MKSHTLILASIFVMAVLFLSLLFVQTTQTPKGSLDHITHALTRDVYGFWPYWVDPNSYEPKWGDLTYVMYYSMTAQSDGSLDDSNMGNYDTVANKARENNVRVAIVVSSFDQDVQDSILANHRTDLVNSILTMLDNYGADGVLVDFPNIRDTNSVTGGANSQLWEDIMTSLYNAVKYKDASYLVAFGTSGAVPNTFRNANLAGYVDSIYLWGYEFHWSNSQNTGAVAPYDDPNQYDITDAVSILENYFPRWKIILGVPLYGYEWPAESDQPGARTTGAGVEYSMKVMENRASDYGRKWDSGSHTPWYAYQDGGQWYQGWYDDRESLRLKWNYVMSEGLGGTGLWSLSNEDPGIWGDLTDIFWKDTHGLVKEVYAFYPYWVDPSWYQSWYNPDMWNAVSYISYAYLHANADGSLDESNMTNYNTIYNLAKEHGVKVTISIDAFDQDVQDSIFAYHADDFANNVLDELQKYNADGVNIDFELPRDTNKYTGGSNTVLFENFMQKLHNTLKNANPDYHISFCVAYSVENVFRNANLGQYVDHVFLMGYDYYFQDPTHTGPVAPYNDPTRMDEVDSVLILENYFPKWQIILGVPFYGRHWLCDSDKPGANATYGEAILMRQAVQDSQNYGRKWDSNSHTPWYVYYGSDGYYHQIWYDDSQSLAMKWKYVLNTGLGGTGIWSLGSEDNGIWDVLIDMFTETPPEPVPELPRGDLAFTIIIIAAVSVIVLRAGRRE